MPRRKPIDPHGWYHVGSRGCYGQTIFRKPEECELFLDLYWRAAKKYGWVTPEWALMGNHHHFVIKLTDGGLSEGWREVHGMFSRQIHKTYGLTKPRGERIRTDVERMVRDAAKRLDA